MSPYEKLFTHNIDLINLNEKFEYLHPTGHWVNEESLVDKCKLVSMIASTKKILKCKNSGTNMQKNEKKN